MNYFVSCPISKLHNQPKSHPQQVSQLITHRPFISVKLSLWHSYDPESHSPASLSSTPDSVFGSNWIYWVGRPKNPVKLARIEMIPGRLFSPLSRRSILPPPFPMCRKFHCIGLGSVNAESRSDVVATKPTIGDVQKWRRCLKKSDRNCGRQEKIT